jgi:DNA-binding GntR family transcriptional regulator
LRAEPARLSSLSRPRAWEEAVHLLRNKILSEELPPGTRLVENIYAKQLGISQGTFREALARLEHEGLVLSVPRRGTYVAALPVDTVNRLYELRERVEPLAMRLAMKSLRKPDVEYLEHQLGRLDARTTAEQIDADMAFHRRLYELTGFPPLQSLWPQIEILTRKILSMSRRLGSTETTKHNHQSIMKSLVKGDVDGLERAIRDHMRQTAVVFGGRDRNEDHTTSTDGHLNAGSRHAVAGAGRKKRTTSNGGGK